MGGGLSLLGQGLVDIAGVWQGGGYHCLDGDCPGFHCEGVEKISLPGCSVARGFIDGTWWGLPLSGCGYHFRAGDCQGFYFRGGGWLSLKGLVVRGLSLPGRELLALLLLGRGMAIIAGPEIAVAGRSCH